ncbi:hypothetical protein LTR17_015813 [Elasticomyces elasticus]|nr:hypothetical protein LTR17_015813 [Elasticomyces elasticus]
MDFTALFHALLLILSIPNKALNSLNSLLNAYPRTIGPPPPPPVITAIAYRYLTAVSSAYTFETHGTISPTYTAMPRYTAVGTTPSYFLTNAAPATSLYTESHESSELALYEMPTARHFEYPIMTNNAVYFWLLILMVVYLASMWANRRCEVQALRHRCGAYEALQRNVKEKNDGLVKEKLTALATISRVDMVLNLAVGDLTAVHGEIGSMERMHRERIDDLVKDKAAALTTISLADTALNVALGDLAAAYGEIGSMERMHRERIDDLVKDKAAALTTISLADTALNVALGDLAAAYGEIGTIEKEKLAAINLRIKVQAVCDRVKTRQDLPALLLSNLFGENSRLEVLCEDLRAQIKKSSLFLTQAGDELTSAISKHARAEAQNGELEKQVVRYKEEVTNLRKSEKEKTEALEEAEKNERLKYDAARRPETTQKFLTKALALTARRTEAQVGELTVTVNDLQDACNSFAILLNDTLSKCEPIESRDVKERYDELMHQLQQRRNVSAAHQAPWDVLQGRHTVETATPNDLTSDGYGFAQSIATFDCVDDSATSNTAHSPCGLRVAVRLPPGAKQDATISSSTPDPEKNTKISSSVPSSSHIAEKIFKQVSQAGDGRGTDSVSRTRDDGKEAADTTFKAKRQPGQGHKDKRKLERLHLQPSYNAMSMGHVAATAPLDNSTSQVDDSTYGSTSPQSNQADSSTLSEETDLLDGTSGQHEMGSTTMSTGERRESAQAMGEHGRSRVLGGGEERMVAPRGPASMAPMTNWGAALNGGPNLRRGMGLSCWAPGYVKDADVRSEGKTDK